MISMKEDTIQITLPRLSGYKTLFINSVLTIFGTLAVVFPAIGIPDPAAIGQAFDSGTALAVALVAIVNIILRLMTSTPAGPVAHLVGKRSGGDDMPASNLDEIPLPGHWSNQSGVKDGPPTPQSMTNFLRAIDQHLVMERSGIAHQVDSGPVYLDPHLTVGAALATDAEQPKLPLPHAGAMERMSSGFLANTARACLVGLVLVFAAGGLGACSVTKEISAVMQAETLEQRAFSLYGTFTVIEERAALVVTDRRIPKATRQRIQQLDRIAKPAADSMIALARNLSRARNTGSSESLVAGLSQQLQYQVAEFGPKLQALTAAVEGAR